LNDSFVQNAGITVMLAFCFI